MPEAPILILLPPIPGPPDPADIERGPDDDPMVLGLSLVQRTVLAARRAGYGRTLLLGDKGAAGALPSSLAAPLILAPAAILAEADWLEQIASARIEPAAWAALPGRIVMASAASAPAAADALNEDGGVRDLRRRESRLARLFGPPAPIPAEIDPMVVETPADVRAAERRLLRSLVKDTDGFMARHVERPISLAISRRLARTAITPNQMSLISIAVGICGGPFFLSSRPLMQTIGALLFLAHSILDGCDGELARLKFQQSRWGGILDFWGDNVVHTVIFGSMGVGWSLSAGALWPLALGAGAVLGTLGSAGFVYWRLMRGKDGADTLFTSVSASPEPASDATARFRLAPRFHLSGDPACAFRPVGLVPGPGGDRRADLFSAGAFRRQPAGRRRKNLALPRTGGEGGPSEGRWWGRGHLQRPLTVTLPQARDEKKWRACFRSMSASRAIFRGRAKPSIPESGKRRSKAAGWRGGSTSTGMVRAISQGHGGEHRAVFVYQIDFVPLLAGSARPRRLLLRPVRREFHG